MVGLYDGVVNALVATNASLSQVASDPDAPPWPRRRRPGRAHRRRPGLPGRAAHRGRPRRGPSSTPPGLRCLTVTQNCESWDRTQEATNSLAQAQLAFLQGGTTPAQKQAVQNASGGPRYADLSRERAHRRVHHQPLTTSGSDMADATLAAQSGLATVGRGLPRLGGEHGPLPGAAAPRRRSTGTCSAGSAASPSPSPSPSPWPGPSPGRWPASPAPPTASPTSSCPPWSPSSATRRTTEAEELAETLTPIDIDSHDEIGQLADRLQRPAGGDRRGGRGAAPPAAQGHRRHLREPGPAQPEPPRPPDRVHRPARGERAGPRPARQPLPLDHLATRMRRNAESLLVLAGAEPLAPAGPARAGVRRRPGGHRRGRAVLSDPPARPRRGHRRSATRPSTSPTCCRS